VDRQVIELWAGRQHRRLVDALGSKLNLLVPEPPSREQLAELTRLFDPSAKLAGANRIVVDAQSRIYLTRPTEVDPATVVEAHVPTGLSVAYFVQIQGRSAPVDMAGLEREKRKLRQSAILLLNGLAVRLDGRAWPSADVLSKPLEVKVYLPGPRRPAEVFGVVAPFVPGLAAAANVTLGSLGASLWRTAGAEFELEFWPGEAAVVQTVNPPVALGEWRFRPQLECAVLRLSEVADRTDPAAARVIGQAALTLAATTGGICVDPLEFRMRQPEDLCYR
jgi:hypothetical protein